MLPSVVSVVTTLGEWDIEITIEVKEQSELRKVERDIRRRRALLITELESMPIFHAHKRRYLGR